MANEMQKLKSKIMKLIGDTYEAMMYDEELLRNHDQNVAHAIGAMERTKDHCSYISRLLERCQNLKT